MVTERITVGVEVERRPSRNRWQSHVLRPVALRPDIPDLAPWALIEASEGGERYFAGAADIWFRAADTQVYKDNLESREPSIYVVLRRGSGLHGWTLYLVTVDPSEAHAHVDVGEDLVEALPMPIPILARLSAFVTRHHVERKRWKRKRADHDPETLAPGRGRSPAETGGGDA